MRTLTIMLMLATQCPAQEILSTRTSPVIVRAYQTEAPQPPVEVPVFQKVTPQSPPAPKPPAPVVQEQPRPAAPVPAAAQRVTVTVYTTPGCIPCVKLKAALRNAGIAFEERGGYPQAGRNFQSLYPFTLIEGPNGWRSFTGGQSIDAIRSAMAAVSVPTKQTSVKPPGQQSIIPQSSRVQWQGQWYDANQYRRCGNPNCYMCQYILSHRLAANMAQVVQEATRQPSADEVIDEGLALLRLTSADVLGDLGCGDGRVLIRAVQLSGCRCIGWEIDSDAYRSALQNVAAAEAAGTIPAGRITIELADVTTMDRLPDEVTAAYAYQYPQVLEQFRPLLLQVGRFVTPHHAVPGVEMRRTLPGVVWEPVR